MSKNKIVHIIVLDKFIPDFINFIESKFSDIQNLYIITGGNSSFKLEARDNIIIMNQEKSRFKRYLNFIFIITKYLYGAEKIILHGLWDNRIIYYLFFNPWLLKKCYWVMWGGDFYFPETQSFFKKKIIKKIGHFVTYIEGDYNLVKEWYGAVGIYCECFMYPSNLYKEYNVIPTAHDTINIQVGNSADPSNNHLEVFKKLMAFKDANIKIYVPLSYGDTDYAQQIITIGNDMFGDKFIAMTDFMSFANYLDFLADIDIAIFNHKRQQAMGNTITLLGLGKKVYIRSDVTPWKTFEKHGIQVFDVANINFSTLDEAIRQQNMVRVKAWFSKENLVRQLKDVCGAN